MPENMEAQKRIYPELRITQRTMFARVLGIGFALIGLGMLAWGVTHLLDFNQNAFLFILGAVFIYGGASAGGVDLGEWLMAIAHRRAWQGSQLTTQAKLVARQVQTREDDYGNVLRTYWITFEFESSQGKTALKARVSKAQYDRLKKAPTATVRYAAQNPRVALIEGE